MRPIKLKTYLYIECRSPACENNFSVRVTRAHDLTKPILHLNILSLIDNFWIIHCRVHNLKLVIENVNKISDEKLKS